MSRLFTTMLVKILYPFYRDCKIGARLPNEASSNLKYPKSPLFRCTETYIQANHEKTLSNDDPNNAFTP